MGAGGQGAGAEGAKAGVGGEEPGQGRSVEGDQGVWGSACAREGWVWLGVGMCVWAGKQLHLKHAR